MFRGCATILLNSLAILLCLGIASATQASVQLSAVQAILSDSDNSDLSDNSLLDAVDYFTASGNDANGATGAFTLSTIALIHSEFGVSPASLIGKSDDSSGGPFVGNVEQPSGTLILDSSLDGPLVLTLKAGNEFTAFLFDSSVTDVVGFKFDTFGAMLLSGNGSNGRNLSHASLFSGPTITTTGGNLPEPISLVVWSGLAAAVVSRRRSRS